MLWRSVLCILFFYFKNEIYKKNSKYLCEKNKEEEKKNKSTDIHQTSLNGGLGDLNPKIKVLGSYVLNFSVQL